MALSIRLYITCWILPLSALTFCTLLAYVILNLMPFFLHVPSNVSTVCLIIELRSKVDISSLTDLGSSSLRVRILLVSLVSQINSSRSSCLIYLTISDLRLLLSRDIWKLSRMELFHLKCLINI